MIERIERKVLRKGKAMATETTCKITCDGCGQSRSFVFDKDKLDSFPLWYSIEVEVGTKRFGQRNREPAGRLPMAHRIDACSAACVRKALASVEVPPIDPSAS